MEENNAVVGARRTIEELYEDRNLDALRAIDRLGKHSGQTHKIGRMVLALQAMGKVAAEHLTEELFDADIDVKWSLIRANRKAEVDFIAGGTPPGWSEVRELLYEDLRRAQTLKRLIRDMGIIDPEELRSELLRVEQHAPALAEGVL
jgi:hypothetical protein